VNIEFDIDQAEFDATLMELFQKAKVPCQAAMADAFAMVVDNNFGQDGEDRPLDWVPLSKPYANRVKRPYATLELDGELRSSVWVLPDGQDAAVVETVNPYATAHQWGENNMPPRPFFPITGPDGETVTPYTEAKCLDAGSVALERALR